MKSAASIILSFSIICGMLKGQTTTTDLVAIPTVLTPSEVNSNYGKEFAKHYYVISVNVLNQSAKSVLLQAIAFRPSSGPTVGVLPLATLLQDIQRREQLDFRTRTQQILTYVSLILPGPTPFFKNIASRGTYNQALSIFNLGRTSAFDTFPDFYDKVIALLQANNLFAKNFQIAARSSANIDVFVAHEQVSLGSAAKDVKHPSPAQVLAALGDVAIYSVELADDAPAHATKTPLK